MERRGNPDYWLLFLALSLVCFGLAMIFSASYVISIQEHGDMWYFTKRQALFAFVGFLLMIILMNIPYRLFKRWFVWIGLLSLLPLILVLIPGIGKNFNGAQSWFQVGGFLIQPAEFAKVGLIIYLAGLIAKKQEQFRNFSTGLLPALIAICLFAGLIAAQPDFGTAGILFLSAMMVVVAGGAKLVHLALVGLPMAAALGLWAAFTPHVIKRLTSFLNPWADPYNSGYQLIQSLYAFGSGGLFGVGFGESIQKYDYIIYPQNDFIFAVIGEEWGFVGVAIFFVVYLTFLWRSLANCLRTKDLFAVLLGVGLVSLFGIQALINIGGVTGTIPITGVTLPLISYGGSSLLMCMLSIGIILSISREANRRQEPAARRNF